MLQTDKITALYCRLSQEDMQAGESEKWFGLFHMDRRRFSPSVNEFPAILPLPCLSKSMGMEYSGATPPDINRVCEKTLSAQLWLPNERLRLQPHC